MMSADCRRGRRAAVRLAGPVLVAVSTALAGGDASALPVVRSLPQATPVIPIADPVPETPSTGAPFNELNDALAAARNRLDELSKAAEAVAAAGALRRELAALREQNQNLSAQLEALHTERETHDARQAKLNRTAEAATARARSLDEELVALRWQNAQLNTSLEQAQDARQQALAEAERNREALTGQNQQLKAAVAQSTGEIGRLRQELADHQEEVTRAERARDDAEDALTAMQDRLRHAEEARARFDQRTAAFGAQVAKLEQERDRALAQAAALRAETGELRAQLAALGSELEGTQLANDELEREVTALRAAATSAAQAARRNLAAVEDRIRQLNQALVDVEPAAGPRGEGGDGVAPVTATADDPKGPPVAPAASAATATPRALRREPAAVTAPIPPAVAAPREPSAQAPAPEAAARSDRAAADIGLIKSAHATARPGENVGRPAFADLPLEQRLHVQGLIADLDSKIDQRGLTVTVPGATLFATNSDEVQADAHDALAKVAELLSVYQDRRVLIVGHTDGMGEATYNQTLSERRADLVKEFFVDNFEIDPERLVTRGFGEERPIASNDTASGRRNNRRVEVVILN